MQFLSPPKRRSQMNKMLNCLANKAICAAFVVLGVASASAESVLTTNALYDAVNTDVSVGYQVSGLEGDEIAVVFTNDACEVINWKVPARLENVQFLVVGGGGGGGGGATSSNAGAGGGGGGVVTGSIFSLTKDWEVIVTVGKGGDGGEKIEKNVDSSNTTGTGKAENGEPSAFFVEGVQYVKAPGGGGDTRYNTNGGIGGSNSGSRKASSKSHNFNDFRTNLIYMVAQAFGNGGGKTDTGGSGGGGGGALQVGFPGTATSPRRGGDGGAGLTNSITGVEVVYGSGGGGGSSIVYIQAKGGTGAGDGNEFRNNEASAINGDGFSALANLGGGGGGGGGEGANGGNGGSGIVVLRYSVVKPGIKFFFK
jgi:hypothetical protein